jgi:hypothetical protein
MHADKPNHMKGVARPKNELLEDLSDAEAEG